MALTRLQHQDYTVGWICALEIERSAARGMLDEEHPNLPLSAFDQNIYSLGRIGDHNVAIACLPEGMPGTAAAATVANFMSSTFTALRFQLLVGIGGGAPKPYGEENPRNDIRLGDIVVSRPTGEHGGVIQYDFGKAEANGEFVHKGTLRRPPLILLSAIGKIRSDERVGDLDLSKHLQRLDFFPDSEEWKHQGFVHDELFAAEYNHQKPKGQIINSCKDCERDHLVTRLNRKDTKPAIHYGLIATANQVMKDGVKREMIRSKHDILCFEMEAGGLDNFECLVIRGICDYSDTHKNDRWQPYAAATAAAYARELLFKIPARQVSQKRPIPSSTSATASRSTNSKREARDMTNSPPPQPQKRARPPAEVIHDPSDWGFMNKDLVEEPDNIVEKYGGMKDEIVLEHEKRKAELGRFNYSGFREAMMVQCWHYQPIPDRTLTKKTEVKSELTTDQLKQLVVRARPPAPVDNAQSVESSTGKTGPSSAMKEDILPLAAILQRTILYTRSIARGAVVLSNLDNNLMLRAQFDGRLVDAIRIWSLAKTSIMNYIECRSSNVRIHENSLIVSQIITSAFELNPMIPVISFFCEAPPAAQQTGRAPEEELAKPIGSLEPMSGLTYSLAHQLLEMLPPLSDASRPLKQWFDASANNPSRGFDSALELLNFALSMAPSLLFCIIDGIEAFVDGSEEVSSQMSALVDTLREAMDNDGAVFKVLFTNRNRVPALLDRLRSDEIKIISGVRRTKMAGGQAPGRRQLRTRFT